MPNASQGAHRIDTTSLADLGLLWRGHCEACASHCERLSQAKPHDPAPGVEPNVWRLLGSSDSALALFCKDLDGGERLLALACSDPWFVNSFLLPSAAHSQDNPAQRKLSRARLLCARLGSSMDRTAPPLPALFPEDGPWFGGFAGNIAAGIGRANLRAIALIVAPVLAIPPAAATGMPAFAGLAMAFAAAASLSASFMASGRRPGLLQASKIASACWPCLSRDTLRELMANHGLPKPSLDRALVELSTPAGDPRMDEAVRLIRMATASSRILHRDASTLPEPARGYCMDVRAAIERRELSDATRPPGQGRPRAVQPSL